MRSRSGETQCLALWFLEAISRSSGLYFYEILSFIVSATGLTGGREVGLVVTAQDVFIAFLRFGWSGLSEAGLAVDGLSSGRFIILR